MSDNSFCSILWPPRQVGVGGGTSVGSVSLSSVNTWLALSFFAPKSQTMTGFSFYIQSLNGTARLVSLTLELQADAAGSPSGIALETSPMAAGSFSSGVGRYEAPFNAALTGGNKYWVVLKPIATTYPVIRTINSIFGNADTGNRWTRKTSIDGGSTWGSAADYCVGYLVKLADGSYVGNSCYDTPAQNTASKQICGGREVGLLLRSPSTWVSTVGITAMVRRVSTPGRLSLKLYAGGALVATLPSVPEADISASGYYAVHSFLSTPFTLPPDTLLRLVLAASGGSQGNAYYYVQGFYCQPGILENNFPLQNTAKLTISDDSGATWSNTSDIWLPISLMLDSKNPFPTPPINRRTSTGR